MPGASGTVTAASGLAGLGRPKRPAPSSPFEHRLERYGHLTGSLPKSIRLLLNSIRCFEPGAQLLNQGEPAGSVFIIDDGWTFSSSAQHTGARQVLDVQIPGDMAGLQSLARPVTLHDVTAITHVKVYEISSEILAEAIAADSALAPFLLWLSAGESAVAAERLTDLGRRSALERTAHFILELEMRMRLVGAGSDAAFQCPMTQYLFGDALGLTSIHVNRMMRELRTAGLAHQQRGWIRVLDRERLVELAKFDSAYLDCACSRD